MIQEVTLMGLKTRAVQALKRILPQSLVHAVAYRAEKRYLATLHVKSREGVFESIYRDGVLGRPSRRRRVLLRKWQPRGGNR